MPPKKQKGPSAKTVQKEKAKLVEDKTFGLKNKNKSKAVQQYVKQVTTQVMDGGNKKVSRSQSRVPNQCSYSLFGSFREASVRKRKHSTSKRLKSRSLPPRRPS